MNSSEKVVSSNDMRLNVEIGAKRLRIEVHSILFTVIICAII